MNPLSRPAYIFILLRRRRQHSNFEDDHLISSWAPFPMQVLKLSSSKLSDQPCFNSTSPISSEEPINYSAYSESVIYFKVQQKCHQSSFPPPMSFCAQFHLSLVTYNLNIFRARNHLFCVKQMSFEPFLQRSRQIHHSPNGLWAALFQSWQA